MPAALPQPDRRLQLLGTGALCLTTLPGCGGGGDATGDTTSGSTTSGTTTTGTTASCTVIPEETAGPYPGDGSNSNASGVANVLALAGVVRSDIRQSIGGASAVASGVPLTVVIELVNTNGSCASLEGYAIYLWHCDSSGGYSLYSSGITGENYLRGVQATGADGRARFTTIFPGCYSGRMPHIHFEVYRTLAQATSAVNKIKTSQLAFPAAPCAEVYATTGYAGSAANFARISFATDNVFADGVTTQLATVSASLAGGYTATLQVGIAA